ncbi:MAG: hypothetical protein ORN98_04285 [Alphaproteobacteria bacterium]|nr:hypothetical protein [Alphaproteobacteria bacterium]
MTKFSQRAFLAVIAFSTSLGLGGCTLMQSTVANSTSGWWSRDDSYDPTKIQPVYCYKSLSAPECYAEPLPAGSNRSLIGEQHPYKSAKQIADEKEAAAQPTPLANAPAAETNPDNKAVTEPAPVAGNNAAQDDQAKKKKKKPEAANNGAGLAVPTN